MSFPVVNPRLRNDEPSVLLELIEIMCYKTTSHSFRKSKVALCPVRKRPWDLNANEISFLANGVPKLIHQTWKDDSVPEHWLPGVNAWKTLHPDWIYCLWTDDDLMTYILDKHADFWPIFSR